MLDNNFIFYSLYGGGSILTIIVLVAFMNYVASLFREIKQNKNVLRNIIIIMGIFTVLGALGYYGVYYYNEIYLSKPQSFIPYSNIPIR